MGRNSSWLVRGNFDNVFAELIFSVPLFSLFENGFEIRSAAMLDLLHSQLLRLGTVSNFCPLLSFEVFRTVFCDGLIPYHELISSTVSASYMEHVITKPCADKVL